jgi:nucleoside-triphosphatase
MSVSTTPSGASAQRLLLTGAPGVGKTTVIRTVAAGLRGWRLGGFFTEEIRAGRERQGFALVTFDQRRTTMAHVDRVSGPRVSKYGVDVAATDEMARSALALREKIDLYLVDEIGRMECLSPAFVAGMRTLLNAGVPLVATIGLRGAFCPRIRRIGSPSVHTADCVRWHHRRRADCRGEAAEGFASGSWP